MKKLKGVITAMTTCFDENDQVDVSGMQELTEFLIESGVNCLYPCGTTGEMHLLSVEERKLIAETVVNAAAGRVTVYIQVGAMTTKDTIELAKHAFEIGADGIGVVTPSYFHVNDEAMIDYFLEVASSVPDHFPVYLYGIPQCAGNDISAYVAESCAKRSKNIIGIKYSYQDMHKICEYLKVNNGDFSVVVGLDRLFLSSLAIGCDGTVSGVSCPMPEPFVNVYRAFLRGDFETAKRWHNIAHDVVVDLKAGSDMSIFKHALDVRGLKGGFMRKPLKTIDENEKEHYTEVVQKHLGVFNQIK
ncbi:MAG: dihydrodipicolinate synthase family protein [Clostridiales bacterium 38-18]|nr:MAG: dihydrodipicolinate synthase family protein [Clostridiales bacterium 38-18]